MVAARFGIGFGLLITIVAVTAPTAPANYAVDTECIEPTSLMDQNSLVCARAISDIYNMRSCLQVNGQWTCLYDMRERSEGWGVWGGAGWGGGHHFDFTLAWLPGYSDNDENTATGEVAAPGQPCNTVEATSRALNGDEVYASATANCDAM